MFTATRPVRTSGALPDALPATGAHMDSSPLDARLTRLVERAGLPLVVLDIGRAVRQYRALRASFPGVNVHYDVSALAHPALVRAIADDGGSFVVAHDGALAALTAARADFSRVLHATPIAHPQEIHAAYNSGVRRFIVDGPADLERFAGSPSDLRLLVRLRPDGAGHAAHALPRGIRAVDALRTVRHAAGLGVRVAGFSLAFAHDATPQASIAGLARTVALTADLEAATGVRFDTIDLGDAFPGRALQRAADRAELAAAIRAMLAPATSRIDITASASSAVTRACITLVAGTVERDVDPLTASDAIDAGAAVAIIRDDEGDAPGPLTPFVRAVAQARHRILRGRRTPQTWSSSG